MRRTIIAYRRGLSGKKMGAVREVWVESLLSAAFEKSGVGGRAELTKPVDQRAGRVARRKEFDGVRSDFEAQPFSTQGVVGDGGTAFSQNCAIPPFDRRQLADCNGHLVDADDAIGMLEPPRNALVARRDVFDQKRRNAAVTASGEGQEPFQLVAVRPLARPWNRIVDRHAGGAQLLGVAAQIVRLKTKIHEPLAFLQWIPPSVVDSVTVEGDDLEVGAVLEGDQRIVTANRVLPAGHDGKAELFIILGGLRQVLNHYHEMIDSLNHRRLRSLVN